MTNPRYANGTLRRKHRQRLKAMGAECGICKGLLGAIHYEEPSNAQHPLSFVVDEIIPISKWQQAGYRSKREAAEDFNNLQAAHWICNARKSDKLNYTLAGAAGGRDAGIPNGKQQKKIYKSISLDGEW